MFRSCMVALLLVTVGLMPAALVAGLAILVSMPAAVLLSRDRHGWAFVVAVIPASLVAVAWAGALVAFLRSDLVELATGWSALFAWAAGFVLAQVPFTSLARTKTKLPGGEVLRSAFGWGWPVAAAAFLVFGFFPSTLPPWS